MKNPRLRTILATGIAAVLFVTGCMPAHAQWTVFDPTNFSQNVLTAARELQQVNNQITSLQNQTQMLLNQARNLTSLPYSSLQAIEQSISRTQQLLNQAQRIGYDINQIDQVFGRSYPQTYAGSTSSRQLVGDAQTRWQNSLAAHQDALRVQAWSKRWIPRARRPMGSCHRANRRSASCRRAKPATS